MTRPSWDEYFMGIAMQASLRSTCLRRRTGAVLVKNRRILATGYNGPPAGLSHCDQKGCVRAARDIASGQNHELCRGIHAEQNGIIQAARHGIPIEGATLYSTLQPCVQCSKMLLNAGVTEIVFREPYPDALSIEMLDEAGVRMRIVAEESSERT